MIGLLTNLHSLRKAEPEGKRLADRFPRATVSAMKKAVIYCRVSTEEQVQNLSLGSQRRQCVEYCDKNRLQVVREFVEEGESAKTADRTQLRKLLEFCRQQRDIAAVVVLRIDRWTRNTSDHVVLRMALKACGTQLHSATEPIDSSPAGKFVESMLSNVSEFDNNIRADRTKNGMKAALQSGRWTFPPPLGYVAGRDAHGHKTILPDAKAGPLVQEALCLFASGTLPIEQIRREITTRGLLTKKGKKVSAQTFNQLLRKPVYSGRIVVPRWGIDTKGNFEALVAEGVFDAIQRRLSGKSVKSRQKIHPDFPLRNFVRCGSCGRPMTASKSRGRSGYYAYYHCQSSTCKHRIKKKDLENAFQELLGRLSPKMYYLDLFRELLARVLDARQVNSRFRRDQAERKLAELKN